MSPSSSPPPKNSQSANQSAFQGSVLEVSRRFVTLLGNDGAVITGKLAAKKVDLVAGDTVSFEQRNSEVFVTESVPAVRSLYRTFHGSVKRMGANIDQLCVITASGATWNPVAIDRMLAAGRVQAIPTVLVVNKVDLGVGEIKGMIETYATVGIPVLQCSAKRGEGLDQLTALLEQPGVRVVALCGVSGVGKSTILNALVPGAKTRTGEVSDRTGQGRQTTSQPRGFIYRAHDGSSKIVIDLPGVQFFGLAHLTSHEVAVAFQEIAETATGCRFRDCKHVKEKECAVREAVEQGRISSWRYHSYLQILEEVEEAKEY